MPGLNRKAVYEAVKALDNGSDIVDFLTVEFGKIGTAESAARIANKEIDELKGTLESKKGLFEYLEANKLNEDSIKELVSTKEATMTEAEKVLKEVNDLRTELNTVKSELTTEREAKKQLEQSNTTSKLISTFSEAMPNVLPKALKTDLTLAAKTGDLRLNEEGKAEGKIGDVWYPVAEYAEKYKDANPEYIVANPGPNSSPDSTLPRGNVNRPKYTNEELNAMSSAELMALGYEADA